MRILVTFRQEKFDEGYIRFVDAKNVDNILDPRPILSGLSRGVLKIVQSSVEVEMIADGSVKVPYIKSETWVIDEE